MSCHGCATKFGVFNKEKGCPNCGFAFCKKCLRFKAVVSKLGLAEHHVCRSCYDAITNPQKEKTEEQQSAPAVFLKRLESLENPAQPPITVYRHDTRMEQLKTGLAPEDRELVERLEKLKEERKRQRETPTEEDIVRRLAALKGQDPERAAQATKKKETFHLPDTRSDEEKTDDLIKQLLQEQILAAKDISPEEMIAQRLARLRGQDPGAARPQSQSQSDNIDFEALAARSSQEPLTSTTDDMKELEKLAKLELDSTEKEIAASSKRLGLKTEEMEIDSADDAAVEQVVQKAMEEATLGDEELESDSSGGGKDMEELPWCTICNEDATHRCPDCDGDLFCDKCFQEFHQDPDLCHHRHVPFNRTHTVKEKM